MSISYFDLMSLCELICLLMIMCIIVEFMFTLMNMCYCGLILCSIDIILLYDDYTQMRVC